MSTRAGAFTPSRDRMMRCLTKADARILSDFRAGNKYKNAKKEKIGSVSDLLVEGTSGFVHPLKPQEVNLP